MYVMVSVFVSSEVDCVFEPLSGKTTDFKIGICCFSVVHAALKNNGKVWLAHNQDNASPFSTQL